MVNSANSILCSPVRQLPPSPERHRTVTSVDGAAREIGACLPAAVARVLGKPSRRVSHLYARLTEKEHLLMLWAIIAILVILWLLGLVGSIGGSLIHLLLVVALVVLIVQLLTGRRAV